jgi:hypothetical protein
MVRGETLQQGRSHLHRNIASLMRVGKKRRPCPRNISSVKSPWTGLQNAIDRLSTRRMVPVSPRTRWPAMLIRNDCVHPIHIDILVRPAGCLPTWRYSGIRSDPFFRRLLALWHFQKLFKIFRDLSKIICHFWYLFCAPFGWQKQSSMVYHGIWFFTKPDSFCFNVIRNCLNHSNYLSYLNFLNGRS